MAALWDQRNDVKRPAWYTVEEALSNSPTRLTSKASRRGLPGSAFELVKEVDRACREHAEQRNSHCHCEIHTAS
ncbi:hypothetical protein B0G73_11636 [Paraburkholderia sp. BL25I1N1]|nr:hypothetical protein B0G73_11636 [Paraburkholderia sp. BL25I1N1]